MRIKIIWSIVSLILCVLSGFVGAYSMMLLQEYRANGNTLQVRKLELIDAHKGVRATFSVENDGSVFLRMLSKKNAPVVELGVNETPGPYKQYTPSGSLTIRDGAGTPAIRLRTTEKDQGLLSFSSAGIEDEVAVGYMPYGDYVDKHGDGLWGIQIAGPNHKSTGISVFAKDGVVQEPRALLEPPSNIIVHPSK